MSLKKEHFTFGRWSNYTGEPQTSARFFIWPFKRKKEKFIIRGGALQPDEVKRRINEIGVGKQVEILRIGYDGNVDDIPIIVEIIDITHYGFTGRIVNLERLMIESATRNLIYAKKGGELLSFVTMMGILKK